MQLRLGLAAAIALSLTAAAQGPRIDGNWEVKMQMTMPGMPAMPEMTVPRCVTREEAANPQSMLPPSGRGASPTDCKVSDYKVEGNTITFNATCPSQKMTMAAEYIYGADTYTGTMKMETAGRGRGAEPTVMTMKFNGKRLGDCVK